MGGRYPPPGLAPAEIACTQKRVTAVPKSAAPRKKGRTPVANKTGLRARISSPGREAAERRAMDHLPVPRREANGLKAGSLFGFGGVRLHQAECPVADVGDEVELVQAATERPLGVGGA